jgi:predicted signal transduction protein with EAL and GGDEF domain
MYTAKRSGSGYALYAPDQDQNSPERLALETDLRAAPERGELELHFQPKLDLRSAASAVSRRSCAGDTHSTVCCIRPTSFR